MGTNTKEYFYKHICIGCGKSFETQRTNSKYCDKSCFGKHNINGLKNLTSPIEGTPNKSKGRPRDCIKGDKHPMFGKKHSKEAILKIKEKRKIQGRFNIGEKHGNWKGGISKLRERLHMSYEHRQWRKAVLERDNYTCTNCGKSDVKFHAHHIFNFKKTLIKYDIKTYEEALSCKELFDINNGTTLCVDCHKKTEDYGARIFKILEKEKSA